MPEYRLMNPVSIKNHLKYRGKLMLKQETTTSRLSDFKAACESLKAFETDNNFGRLMAHALSSMLSNSPDHVIADQNLHIRTDYAKQISGIRAELFDYLPAIGLDVDRLSGNTKIMAQGETTELKELNLKIVNAEIFTNFLSNALAIPGSRTDLAQCLQLAVRHFEKGLVIDSLDKPSDSTLELFKAKRALLDALDQVGLAEVKDHISKRFLQAENRNLKETILAEKHSLLGSTADKTYAAHSWHRDTIPERYSRQWSETIDALETIAKNPNAAEIASHGRRYLLEAIKLAREEIPGLTGYQDLEKFKKEFLSILLEAEKRLNLA